MAFQPFEHWVDVDLKAEVPIIPLRNGFFTQDNLGARLGANVYDNHQPHTLTGSVPVYCKLADGTTLTTTGTRSGTTAYIDLPSEAYAVVGPIAVTIANKDGTKQKALAIFTGYVFETKTSAQVAPGQAVADLAQIQALYSEMQAAVSSAQVIMNGAVLYSSAQSLTDAQKMRARINIGINEVAVMYNGAQSLTAAQKLQARTNIGVNDSVVIYNTAQSLTDAQKRQARTNIDAAKIVDDTTGITIAI